MNCHPLTIVLSFLYLFKHYLPGDYKLDFNGIDSFTDDQLIYLEDKKDQVVIDLQEQSTYEFYSDPMDLKNRFIIHFDEPVVGNNPMDMIHIYSYENVVYVEVPQEIDGNIQIYDITGRKVEESKAYTGKNQITLHQSSGNYIVKVISSEGVISEKVFIQ